MTDVVDLRRVLELLDAEILSGGERLSHPIHKIVATDLMSSVLAYSEPSTLLLTTLSNVQVVNTAEVAGLVGVVFVRGTRPAPEVIGKARDLELPVGVTPYTLYKACGLLFQIGLTDV